MGHGGSRPGSGRKKGTSALQAELYRQYILEEVIKNQAEIIAAMLNKAKAGDVQAFKELNDRAVGKALQNVDVTTKGESLNFRPSPEEAEVVAKALSADESGG